MNRNKFISVLLSCLIAVPNGMIPVFAAEKTETQTITAEAAAETTAAATTTTKATTTTAQTTTTAKATTTTAKATTTTAKATTTTAKATTTTAKATTTTAKATTTTAKATTTTAAATTKSTTTTTVTTTTETTTETTTTTTETTKPAAVIPTYTVSLDGKNGTSGIVHNADGTVSFFYEGEKLTGHFNIVPDFIKGDICGNDAVDASDAGVILMAAAYAAANGVNAGDVLAERYASVQNGFQGMQMADINNDGEINAADAALILHYSSCIGAGLEIKPIGAAQYYADEDGVLQSGWISLEEDKLYARDDFSLSEGWEKLDGQTFYFSEDASMQTGYIKVDESVFYLGQDGSLTTGWLETKDGVYFFDVNTGAQAFGVFMVDDSYYYFNDQGVMESGGWLQHEDGMRYADENGKLMMAWQTVDGKLHYFDESGIMATGECTIEGSTYLFDSKGLPETGWKTSKEGKRYYQENGLMTVGTYAFEEGLRLFDEEGLFQESGWAEYLKNKYYVDEDGIVQTGNIVLDGIKYHFNADGVYNPVTICLDAGHYGKYNHSPVVSAYWESDFNWKMHLYLKEALESYGIDVITTREEQAVDLALESRGKTSEGCVLFLSIHSNACNVPSNDGPLACCAIDGSADDLGLALANCIADVMETKQRGSIWKRVGERGDYYGVIRGATSVGTPGILLEHSYHTNARATRWLLVDSNVKRMAEAEAKLLAEWFDMI